MVFDVGVLSLLLSGCLSGCVIVMAVPLIQPQPTNTPTEAENESSLKNTIGNIGTAFPNLYAQSSILSSNGKAMGSKDEGEEMYSSSNKKKRDAEVEADSANGKSPIPLLFKKELPLHSQLFTKLFTNHNDYSRFPSYVGSHADISKGFGHESPRQRRSFHFTKPREMMQSERKTDEDEMKFNMNEEFLRLMALLSPMEEVYASTTKANEGNNALPNYNYNNLLKTNAKAREDEINFAEAEEDLEDPLDLGYYGKEPTFFSLKNQDDPPYLKSHNAPNSLDLNRMDEHESEDEPHRLFASAQQLYNSLPGIPLELPLEIFGTKNNNVEDEWMDDAIPLQSNFKARRSDASGLFRHNPVKFHFRSHQKRNENGGSFYPAPGALNRGALFRKRSNSHVNYI